MEEYNKTHAPAKKDDSDKPKKPLSAYFRFNIEKRAEVKAANPGNSLIPCLTDRYEGH